MAKKKELSIEDAVNSFKDVISRGSFNPLLRYNNNIYTMNDKNITLWISVDKTLMELIEKEYNIEELNPLKHRNIIDNMKYLEDINNEDHWNKIPDEDMITDKMISINVNDLEYKIEINFKIFGIRFRKAEVNNFAYRINKDNIISLSVKKKYESPIPDTNFTIMRLFQII